jgi:hypothetical protein
MRRSHQPGCTKTGLKQSRGNIPYEETGATQRIHDDVLALWEKFAVGVGANDAIVIPGSPVPQIGELYNIRLTG